MYSDANASFKIACLCIIQLNIKQMAFMLKKMVEGLFKSKLLEKKFV